MSLIIIICLGMLSVLVFCHDANLHQGQNKNYYYACPKSSKFISPDVTLSPFEVSSDSQNNSAREIPLAAFQISRRIFKKLDMTVLPSREVCIVGKKLKNFILPQHSQFRIMVGIAMWFSPCLTLPTNTQRVHCMDQKVTGFQSINIKMFKTFYEFLSQIVHHM